MHSTERIHINLDKVLQTLFCWYAFSISFELALEILFQIDTILKPFRVLSLLIIGTYGLQVLKNNMEIYPEERKDVLLYFIFLYGILASCIQASLTFFDTNLFYNDLFLVGLHVLVFFIFKATPIPKEVRLKMLRFFVVGVVVNAIYIVYSIFFLFSFGRSSGFIDNPNYASLGLVAVMFFLFLRSGYYLKWRYHFLYIVTLLLLVYVFVITGSRAGLILFVLALFCLFVFSTFRRKIMLFLVIGMVMFKLFSFDSSYAYLGSSLVLINRINDKINSEEEVVRFILWEGVSRVLEDRGYWGIGIGQFKANFTKYYKEESNKLVLEVVNRGYYLSPHNDYLAILVDYGWPSLVSYLFFLYLSMKALLKKIVFPEEDGTIHFLNRFNFVIFSCLIVFGLAAENFQHPLFWFLLMFSTKNIRCQK